LGGRPASDFAPAGYGLGGACVVIDHLDNANQNGYYTSNGGTPDGYWWWGEVYAYSEQAFVQHLVRLNDDNSLVHAWRTYSYGTFTPWEWVNPPMASGVEYRTTERYGGKPIYTKRVNYGYITAGEHSIAHGIKNIDDVVGLEMINSTYGNFTSYFNASADRTNIHLNTPWNMGDFVYIMKYTKL
jgi:hypothetical protein